MKSTIRKILSTVLAVAMIGAMSANVMASEVGEISQEAIPMPLSELEIFIKNLDPSSYGGIYFDEAQNLCINAIDKVAISNLISKKRSAVGNITIKEAKYSMYELNEAREMLKLQSATLGIKMIGFDEQKNSIVVFIVDDSDSNKALVKKVCPVENLIINKYEKSIEENVIDGHDFQPMASSTYAGKKLSKYPGDPYTSTLTTSAVYPYSAGPSGWKVGMMSVAHEFSHGNNCYYQDSIYTGTASYSSNSTYIDAAFIPSSYNTHGWINDNSGNLIQATSRRSPIAGDYAYMYGWKSGNRKYGAITYTGLTEQVGDVWHQGVFQYNIAPLMGDSGAPLVVRNNDGTWSLVGYNVAQYRGPQTNQGLGLDIIGLEMYADIVPCI